MLREGAVGALQADAIGTTADPQAWQFDFEPLPAAAGKTVSHWLLQLREPD